MIELYSLEELNKKVNISKRIVTIGALLPVLALLCAVLLVSYASLLASVKPLKKKRITK